MVTVLLPTVKTENRGGKEFLLTQQPVSLIMELEDEGLVGDIGFSFELLDDLITGLIIYHSIRWGLF